MLWEDGNNEKIIVTEKTSLECKKEILRGTEVDSGKNQRGAYRIKKYLHFHCKRIPLNIATTFSKVNFQIFDATNPNIIIFTSQWL